MATFKKIFTIISYIVTILLIVYIIYEAIPKRTVSPAIDGVRFEMVTTETLFTRTSETTDSEITRSKQFTKSCPANFTFMSMVKKFHLMVKPRRIKLCCLASI